jgi:Chaperone of endosialidase
MATKRIKDLPLITTPVGADFVAVDATTTRTITVDNLFRHKFPASSVNQQIVTFNGTGAVVQGSNAFVDGSGRILGGAGTEALPAHSFIGDPDTGAWNPAANVWALATGGTERLRVTGGAVLLGSTTVVAGGGRLQSTDDTVPLYGRCTNASSIGAGIYLDRTLSDGFMAVFYRAGSAVGSISQAGTSVAYNTTSDARLKTNVLPMAGYGLSVVRRLKPCSFDWITSRMRDYGLIAQEVHEVAPNAVTPGDVWQIDPSKLVAFLIDAIQVLDKRLQALENDGA